MRDVFIMCLSAEWTSNQYLVCKFLCYENDKSYWLYCRCVSLRRPNRLLLLMLILLFFPESVLMESKKLRDLCDCVWMYKTNNYYQNTMMIIHGCRSLECYVSNLSLIWGSCKLYAITDKYLRKVR